MRIRTNQAPLNLFSAISNVYLGTTDNRHECIYLIEGASLLLTGEQLIFLSHPPGQPLQLTR